MSPIESAVGDEHVAHSDQATNASGPRRETTHEPDREAIHGGEAGVSGSSPSEPPEGTELGALQASNSQSPSRQLSQLNRWLEDENARLKALQQEVQALDKDYSALNASASEQDKVVEAYRSALPKLRTRAAELTRYLECEQKVVDKKVGDKKRRVQEALAAVAERLSRWSHQLDADQQRLAEVEARLTTQTEELAEAQVEYDRLKARQKSTDDALKQLEGLRSQLEAADKADDGPRMYVINDLARSQHGEVAGQIIDSEQLRAELEGAWSELNLTKGDVRDTTNSQTKLRLDIEKTQERLRRVEENRVEETVKEYEDLEAASRSSNSASSADAAAGAQQDSTPKVAVP